MMAQKNEIQVYENAVIVATPLPQLENLCYAISALFARQGFVAGKSERVDCRV